MVMHLQLESAQYGTFNLDDVLMTGTGVQALSGATGLGLPQVSAQWLEGAGDGAVYRGRRVLSRDIDLPLYFLGLDRDDLTAKVSQLAKMLSDVCTLRVVNDDGTSWWTEVVHVGGGDYTYGEDTIGEDDLKMVVTLRSGDPYWKSGDSAEASVQVVVNGSATSMPTLRIDNPGDVAAYPVFTVHGPFPNGISLAPALTSGIDGGIDFGGSIWTGETVTFDLAKGRIFDQDGISRYAELSTAPLLFKVPPDGLDVTITANGIPVPGSTNAEGGSLRNFVANPAFETNLTSWDTAFAKYSGTPTGVTITRDTTQKKGGVASIKVLVSATTQDQSGGAGARYKLTGLNPDKFYALTVSCFASIAAKPTTTSDDYYPRATLIRPSWRGTGLSVGSPGVDTVFKDCFGVWQTLSDRDDGTFIFVATCDPDGTLDVVLAAPRLYQNGIYQPYYFDNVYVWEVDPERTTVSDGLLGTHYINGTPPFGLKYFDGSSVVPDFSFWWEGAANASRSSGEHLATSGTAQVDAVVEPRRWAVV